MWKPGMNEDERIWAVKQLLFDFVKSPSLRHIRDPYSLNKLAHEIVGRINRGNSIWGKWDGQREVLLKSALGCWIPIDDLRDFLNRMPGPPLTVTDVAQRLKAFEDEQHYAYPKEELQADCLALYEKEKAQGTELPAIVGLLRDQVELGEDPRRTGRALSTLARRRSNSARAAPSVRCGLQVDPAPEFAALVLSHQW
jgi:hypothetical protein